MALDVKLKFGVTPDRTKVVIQVVSVKTDAVLNMYFLDYPNSLGASSDLQLMTEMIRPPAPPGKSMILIGG